MSDDPSIAGFWPDPPIPDFDSDGYMVPPWIKYPNLERISMGWRMGAGENYKRAFLEWWRKRSYELNCAYRAKYMEPDEWKGCL